MLRHSLVDELADLSDELVTIRDVNHSQPSLLEEIESLHRNLKELESVKDYVEIIHTALCLRFINAPVFAYSSLTAVYLLASGLWKKSGSC